MADTSYVIDIAADMPEAGVTTAQTVLVGDSMIDVETARQAGVAVVVALYGFGAARGELVLEAHERRASSAAQMGEVIRQWVAEVD